MELTKSLKKEISAITKECNLGVTEEQFLKGDCFAWIIVTCHKYLSEEFMLYFLQHLQLYRLVSHQLISEEFILEIDKRKKLKSHDWRIAYITQDFTNEFKEQHKDKLELFHLSYDKTIYHNWHSYLTAWARFFEYQDNTQYRTALLLSKKNFDLGVKELMDNIKHYCHIDLKKKCTEDITLDMIYTDLQKMIKIDFKYQLKNNPKYA